MSPWKVLHKYSNSMAPLRHRIWELTQQIFIELSLLHSRYSLGTGGREMSNRWNLWYLKEQNNTHVSKTTSGISKCYQ